MLVKKDFIIKIGSPNADLVNVILYCGLQILRWEAW